MSAETIPADVLSAAREALAAEFECSVKAFPASPARARRGEMDHTYELKAIVRAILTDRSTRPAEPAAPVAEAADGETYYTKGKDADWFEGLSHQDAAWALTCAAMDLNDTGLGDHVDLFMPHNAMLSGAGDRIKNLCSALEAERARADAAEQRAADALARAEKAEGAGTEDKRRLDWLEANKNAELSHEGFEDDVWQVHTINGGRNDREWTKRGEADTVREAIDAAIRAIPPRASREAQPATDGGDNG